MEFCSYIAAALLDAAAARSCFRSLVRGLMAMEGGERELVCFADNRDPPYSLLCRRSGSDISCSDLRLKAGWMDQLWKEGSKRASEARKEGNNRWSDGRTAISRESAFSPTDCRPCQLYLYLGRRSLAPSIQKFWRVISANKRKRGRKSPSSFRPPFDPRMTRQFHTNF